MSYRASYALSAHTSTGDRNFVARYLRKEESCSGDAMVPRNLYKRLHNKQSGCWQKETAIKYSSNLKNLISV